MSVTQQRVVDRYQAMVAAYANMPGDARAELRAWEAEHVDGSGEYGTSDWPGWDAYVMPADAYRGSAMPAHVTRGRETKRLPFRAVWDRDGWECQHCGDHKNLTVDHIVPVALGGSDDLANLQTLCGICNCRKGVKLL